MVQKNSIYLDYAAATPVDSRVEAAMQPFWADVFYNPSAQYLDAKQAKEALETSKTIIARVLGCRSNEIIFTAGGTEANNLAIQGVMEQYPDGEILISSVEHESVLQAAKLYKCHEVKVNHEGTVSVDEIKKQITDNTVLISVILVNNEIGSQQPVRDIAHIIEEVRLKRRRKKNPMPLLLHTDATQAANYYDLHVSRLGVDMLTINGSKLYGPKQVGALYVQAGVVLKPMIVGGGQEHGLRSGTENVAGAVGLAKALEIAAEMRVAEVARLNELSSLFVSAVLTAIPKASLNGPSKRRCPNNAHFSFYGVDSERLMMELDELGIQCAVGSACSASSDEPSHVLTAIGLTDEQAKSSLRFSLGRQTTDQDIATTVDALKKLVK